MGWGEWAIIAVLAVGLIVWLIERAELKRRGLRRGAGRWKGHHDWAGWSFGFYPTNDDPRCLILQNIKWYCTNFDVCWSERHNWRFKWVRRRNSLVEANRRHLGERPEPRLSAENYGA